ncbi:uncharacterized protein FA14DRAFT_74232 [Meira miltonrushii]|uniref:Uncharacterized protein n=1 Tax=Meira miltonrushii TaxID=1280837 RepID=A0A316V4I4_9BASI|nr:uncharacterized protein FA14DRAFT_74232 [Meira miltonrushii]PWN32456.1 hypothetical protein FA14DRAFT_74232 [Meira miltonrushii]
MLFQVVAALSLVVARTACQTYNGSTTIHFTTPAGDYTSVLPIGNGRLGITMYGSAAEKLVLNEDSIWNGNFQNRVNPNAKAAWPKVRQDLLDNKYNEAGNYGLANMVPENDEPGVYNTGGYLTADLGQNQNSMADYTRWLDTISGITGANYTYNGVQFSRLAVASYPDNVLAIRFSSEQPFDATLALGRDENVYNKTASTSNGMNQLLTYAGSGSSPGGLDFAMQARAVVDSGSVSVDSNTLKASGMKTLDVFMDIQTTYRESDYKGATDTSLDAAVSKGFDTIRNNAVQDHSNLHKSMQLSFGSSSNSAITQNTTDQRLAAFKNSPDDDIELMTLVYNFGRHLIIGSSRQGNKALPANLMGLWWNTNSPPFAGRFTININIEMNYWAVGAGNLAPETQMSLFDLMDVARPRALQMAKDMYGIEQGLVMHHNTDLWGDSAPTDNGTEYTLWPMSAPWLSTHYLEHVRFTNDLDLLKNRALPFMLDTAAFYDTFLFEYNGSMVTGPSLSPENPFYMPKDSDSPGTQTGMDIAPAMDNQLLWQLYNDIDEAYSLLGDPNNSNATKYRALQAKLRPNFIGSYGEILEWRYEYVDADPGHRHLSPLWALHPGKQFSPLLNETLANASRILLDNRMINGGGNTGWSRAWVSASYARLLDADTSWANAQETLKHFLLVNLWNTDSGSGTPYQIDGNFGFLSAIQEMIMQSHTGTVHLLPALSSNAAKAGGSVTNMLARYGFSVDMEWDEGPKLKQAVITSNLGNELTLRLTNGTAINVDGNAYKGPVKTSKGQKLTVTLA